MSVEKTYVITNYEVDIPDEDCKDINGAVSTQVIKDSIADEIYDSTGCGDFKPEEEGELIETDYTNDPPEFIKSPVEVKPE